MQPPASPTRNLLPAFGRFLARCWIYLGLPVLGWGLSDPAGFFRHPARLGLAAIVIATALFDAWLVMVSPPEPDHEHRFDLPRWPAYLFEIIFVVAALGDRTGGGAWPENLPLRWLGLGIYAAGSLLLAWANLAWLENLRRPAGLIAPDPTLLYTGPYRHIRYPGQLAVFLYCLGISLALRSWAGLVLLPVLVVATLYRIHHVERIYAETYRQAWPLRRHSSKRLIPRVY